MRACSQGHPVIGHFDEGNPQVSWFRSHSTSGRTFTVSSLWISTGSFFSTVYEGVVTSGSALDLLWPVGANPRLFAPTMSIRGSLLAPDGKRPFLSQSHQTTITSLCCASPPVLAALCPQQRLLQVGTPSSCAYMYLFFAHAYDCCTISESLMNDILKVNKLEKINVELNIQK